ncbi:hypothetical protein [Poritiphilus flavus]|uniref:Uncharacterized protein n=1 Tax=Poritiphilus flavus TaxID=2697053 RepID=A0A6L9E7L6_9FLAO|nr:hypothetical protein [Poritiphilus flavus]NAS10592.1 hypothetical protein [Poritiphilus flavus]
MSNKDLDQRLKHVETNLIEQEHRPIHVITNYLYRKKKWPDDEEQQLPAKRPLFGGYSFPLQSLPAQGG